MVEVLATLETVTDRITTDDRLPAPIQLISRHESKRSLEVHQHLSLETVAEAYQEVMKSVGV